MSPHRPGPVLLVHGGAGPAVPSDSPDVALRRDGLMAALHHGRAVLADGGDAVDAAVAAVCVLENAEPFNAGRGAVLCADGTVELSAAVMRGHDREAGAVAAIGRTRQPVLAARAVMESSPHVLLCGAAGDALAASVGLEACEPAHFVTERQRRRLVEVGSDFERGTVGAVCLDGAGRLAAATSTGGRRGQLPGRVGDTPLIGAGTWADDALAVSCTGDGEQFIRAVAAHQLAHRLTAGVPLAQAADAVLGDVASLGGHGGLIAVSQTGELALPFTTAAMSRGVWRAGGEPECWV